MEKRNFRVVDADCVNCRNIVATNPIDAAKEYLNSYCGHYKWSVVCLGTSSKDVEVGDNDRLLIVDYEDKSEYYGCAIAG